MTPWDWLVIGLLIALYIFAGIVIAIENTVGTIINRTRERVSTLEDSLEEVENRLWNLEHPTRPRCMGISDKESEAGKVGFPTEFAKRVSAIYRTRQTGEDED
jgi:hypothetical protein